MLSFATFSGDVVPGPEKAFESRMDFLSVIKLDFENKDLYFSQIGEAERKFLFFSIYDVAYYLSEANDDGLQGSALLIQYKRDIAVKKIHAALTDGFKENINAKGFKLIEPKLERLLEKIDKDITEGDILLMYKLLDGRVLFYFNNQLLLAIQGQIFAETLWSIWLGKNAVVNNVKLTNP